MRKRVALLRRTLRGARAGAKNVEVFTEVGQGGGQVHRARQAWGEIDRIPAGVDVGAEDGLAQRAGAGVVEVGHRERAEHRPLFQALQPRPEATGTSGHIANTVLP